MDWLSQRVFDNGFSKGEVVGKAEGQELGETRLSKLIQVLLADNRVDEVLRATKDQEARQLLYKQYHILD